jgi:hypothetical protein
MFNYYRTNILSNLVSKMAKKKEKSTRPEVPTGLAGMSPALWLVPFLAVLVLLFYLALSMGSLVPSIFTLFQWKLILIGIQLLFIAILISSHALDKRSTVCDEGAAAEEVKAEIIEEKQQPSAPLKTKGKTAVAVSGKSVPAPTVPRSSATPVAAKPESNANIVEYPEKVSGGIYADTHLPLGDGRFLKLRTLIARSCLLCEEHDKCFTLVRQDMSADGFDSNIDCKQGLDIAITRA